MAHTPGPWHLEAEHYIAAGPVASPGEIGSGPLIADVLPHPGVPCRIPDASEQAANAALLIAAPEMLAALEAWVRLRDGGTGARHATLTSAQAMERVADMARNAIAKATREPA